MATETAFTAGAITEEQAEAALHQLVEQHRQGTASAAPAEVAETPAPQPQAATTEEPAAPEADTVEAALEPAEAVAAPAADNDDVASLKQRLESALKQRDEDKRSYDERVAAISQRSEANARILNDRFMRKASVADKAGKMLRRIKDKWNTEGVPEADVETIIREVDASMNPQSASYSAPTVPDADREEQALTLNAFLNDKAMSGADAEAFGKWLNADAQHLLSASEQRIAEKSVSGFLHVAHRRWQDDLRDKADKQQQAVAAAQTVQRVQKAAARAATAAPAAPRKQNVSANPTTVDVSKLTQDDVAKLLRQSVEEYQIR